MTESPPPPPGVDGPSPKMKTASGHLGLNGQGKRDPRPSRRRRKALAALASGLVLGLGAAATLATWNDSEFVNGTFSAGGDVDIQGSTDGGVTWSSNTTAPGKTLSFSLNASKMVPGEPAYAPFAVRLSPGSAVPPSGILAGELTVKNVDGDLRLSLASYGWARYPNDAPDHTCSTTSLPLAEFDSGWDYTPLAIATQQVHRLTLSKNPVHLCFVVLVGPFDGTYPGATTVITWQFRTKS